MATHTADTLHLNEIIGFLRSALAGAGYGGALDVGIVCGSGLSNLSASIEGPLSIPYASIPHFPRSTVQGHGTELVFGRLGGKLVAAARGLVASLRYAYRPAFNVLPKSSRSSPSLSFVSSPRYHLPTVAASTTTRATATVRWASSRVCSRR